ncbi:alpha/beta fold hydrolase, partial [Pseudomonas indica]|uniref:alpha/beta fold hydrolase n=1 Tax=Pseudomonas indica TaxID=137658 RepID=UPI003FD02594
WREAFRDQFFYILHFQEPGVAEAELDADIERSLRLLLGELDRTLLHDRPAGHGLFDGLPAYPPLPAWCDADTFDAYRQSLARGFHGPLNWYRNFERNWEETAPFAGQLVTPPTLFLVGDNDPVARLEAHTLKRMADVVPHLEQHRLPNCGHWLQGEQPQRVNALLLDFLARHYPA